MVGQYILQSFALDKLQRASFKYLLPKESNTYDNSPITLAVNTDKDTAIQDAKSFLGSMVFSDLNLSDTVTGQQIKIDTALFTVSQSKKIVETDIQGRNGTVKEFIALGDYQINIKGVLLGSNGSYPSATSQNNVTVPQLIDMCQINRSLTVNSWYLIQFGIFDIVIKDFTLTQNEGEQSIQPFELSCVSDTPFEINITN